MNSRAGQLLTLPNTGSSGELCNLLPYRKWLHCGYADPTYYRTKTVVTAAIHYAAKMPQIDDLRTWY
jgi:hypothetical protein